MPSGISTCRAPIAWSRKPPAPPRRATACLTLTLALALTLAPTGQESRRHRRGAPLPPAGPNPTPTLTLTPTPDPNSNPNPNPNPISNPNPDPNQAGRRLQQVSEPQGPRPPSPRRRLKGGDGAGSNAAVTNVAEEDFDTAVMSPVHFFGEL